jgi:hypothetical protein
LKLSAISFRNRSTFTVECGISQEQDGKKRTGQITDSCREQISHVKRKFLILADIENKEGRRNNLECPSVRERVSGQKRVE